MRFAADENFDNDIVRGILRQNPTIELVRIQDVGLYGADDRRILEWCVDQNRALLTHDVNTMIGFALERIKAELPITGIIVVPNTMPIRQAIEDLLLIIECSLDGEWDGKIVYLPFR